MAQTMINFRIDENVKRDMEDACKNMGMSLTTAFTIFALRVGKDRRIPFEVAADPDPFYSEANMVRLRKSIADVKAGKNMTVHELIEVYDD
jgi:DNA-damage-inducible protein J